MKFKVGDKARLVNLRNAPNQRWHVCEGDEVTILGLPGCEPVQPDSYRITRPAHYPRTSAQVFTAQACYLVPLTPPNESDNEAARQFIERMKRIAHEPMPVKENA